MRILRKRFILLPIAAALIASLNLTPAFALGSANGGYPPGSGGKDSYGSRGHKSGSGGYSHNSGGYSSGSGDEYMYNSGGYSYDSGDEYMYNSGGYSYDSGDEYMYNSGGYSYDSGDEYMYNSGGYSYDSGDEYMYNSGGYSYDSGGYSYGSGGEYSHGSPGYSGRYHGGYSYGKEKNAYPAPLYKAPSSGYPGYPEYHTPNRVYAVYVVQRGDTLASIARRFRTSVAALLAANPAISNPDLIFPGQKLIIPLSKSGSTGAYGYGYGSPAPPPGYSPSKPMMPPKGMPGGHPPPGYQPSKPMMPPPKGMPDAPPPAPPPGMPPPAQQTVTIDLAAANVAFSMSTIQVPAGARVVVNFDNQDGGIPHNFAVYTDSSAQQVIFRGSVITGPARMTYTFTAPSQPGMYFFRCDVHPMMMTGTFVVG